MQARCVWRQRPRAPHCGWRQSLCRPVHVSELSSDPQARVSALAALKTLATADAGGTRGRGEPRRVAEARTVGEESASDPFAATSLSSPPTLAATEPARTPARPMPSACRVTVANSSQLDLGDRIPLLRQAGRCPLHMQLLPAGEQPAPTLARAPQWVGWVGWRWLFWLLA